MAYALISATMWILAWAVVFMRKLAPRRVIGCVFGLQFLALPCGFAAAKLMQWYAAGHIGAELLPYVGFAAVTVLVVAYVFVHFMKFFFGTPKAAKAPKTRPEVPAALTVEVTE